MQRDCWDGKDEGEIVVGRRHQRRILGDREVIGM